MLLTSYLTLDFLIISLAGFVGAYIRGFTGFGSNLVWAPVLVMFIDPIQAVAIMGLVGFFGTTQIAIPVYKIVGWKEIYPIIIASWATAPIGVLAIYLLEPETVRRIIGLCIIIITFTLSIGWVYKGPRLGIRGRIAQICTGGLAGWLSGFGGIGGSVPVLYFMANNDPTPTQRANNIVAALALIPMVIGVLVLRGEINQDTIIQAGILFIPFSVGTWLGTHSFNIVEPSIFRKVTLVILFIIGFSAIGI